MIEQITVNPINESLFSAEFLKGFRCGAKIQYQADVEGIAKAKLGRPTGKWIEIEDWDGEIHYQCDQCKSEYVLIDGTPQDNDYNYCPHCGAKLGGEEE